MNMTHLVPAVHGRLSEHVSEQLREAILTGSFKPGERLREVDLASMLKEGDAFSRGILGSMSGFYRIIKENKK